MQVYFGCSLIKGREKKRKKKSLETILRMVSVAVACLPAAVRLLLLEALFMQISWGELSTHLALQALFTQSSPVHEPLLQAFPFPSTLGKVTLHPLSQACMFIYSSCGKWVFAPLLCSFPTTTTFTSFSALDYWAVLLLLPATVCLQIMWEVGLPSSSVDFSSLRHSHKLSLS
jgi:hypothetical protein